MKCRIFAPGLTLIAACALAATCQGASFYVAAHGGSDTNSGTSPQAAKQTIQAAVDAAKAGDTISVAPGRYETGGRAAPKDTVFNRLVVDKAVLITGAKGASETLIFGSQDTNSPARCAHLSNGAQLIGFTLTGGYAQAAGGGVYCAGTNAVLENCVVEGNRGTGAGGGVCGGILRNCVIRNNEAVGHQAKGGGVYAAVLDGCVIEGNSVPRVYQQYGYGAGAAKSTLTNCRVLNNIGYYGAVYECTALNCQIFGTLGLPRDAMASTLTDCVIGVDPLNPGKFYVVECKLEGTNTPYPTLRLPAVFGSRMVLQQGVPLPIWGWAGPQKSITMRFAGKTYKTVSAADGTWRAVLDAQAASAEPRALEIAVEGAERVILENVLVGEVWLCSGQSNMYLPLYRTFCVPEDFANDPMLRLFRVDYDLKADWSAEQADVKAGWSPAVTNSITYFSAVGIIFGKRLRQELKIPVGLISSTCGDTMAENWSSMAALKANPLNKEYLDEWDKKIAAAMQAKASGTTNAAAFALLTSYTRPARLFNGMIAPLIPYGIRGTLWYQGEANHRRVDTYGAVLRDMIADWRKRWNQGAFPFLLVQLPNSNIGTWPSLRQMQLEATRMPDVYMAVALDAGERLEIHPKNKRAVAERLALVALNRVYKMDMPCFSPLGKKAVRAGDKVRVSFANTYGGLMTGKLMPVNAGVAEGTDERALPGVPGARVVAQNGILPERFEVAGADGIYQRAQAELAGDEVLVSSEKVTDPRRVRFAWDADPNCNLYNKAGLPAAPFELEVSNEGK